MTPWVLSAKTPQALTGQAHRLTRFLVDNPDLDLLDVGLSLTRRSVFEHRAVILGTDRETLVTGLGELAHDSLGTGLITGSAQTAGKTVLVFPGQGSQWVGMGSQLLDASPVFAEQMRCCGEALGEFVDWSLLMWCGGFGAPRGWTGWMWCSRCCGR